MSNVIQFLESLGGRSAPSVAEYAAIVGSLDIHDEHRQALLQCDATALSSLLEGRTKMFFMVATPDKAPNEAPDQDDGYVPDTEEPADPDRGE